MDILRCKEHPWAGVTWKSKHAFELRNRRVPWKQSLRNKGVSSRFLSNRIQNSNGWGSKFIQIIISRRINGTLRSLRVRITASLKPSSVARGIQLEIVHEWRSFKVWVFDHNFRIHLLPTRNLDGMREGKAFGRLINRRTLNFSLSPFTKQLC